jgi:hypothetical protein
MARGSSPDTDMMVRSSAPRNDSLGAAPDSDSDGYNSPVEELKAFSRKKEMPPQRSKSPDEVLMPGASSSISPSVPQTSIA